MKKIASCLIPVLGLNFLWIVGVIWLLAACANVTFHTDAALTQRTGLKYYTAKPYLLIAPTGNKDAPLKAEIISLPDLEHPTYAIYHPGWGQHIFSLAVASNGNLSSYGQTADSKGPETIAALGSLLGSAGTAASGFATAVKKVSATMIRDLSPVEELINAAISNLSNISTLPPDSNNFVVNTLKITNPVIEKLKNSLIAIRKGEPNQQENLKNALNQINDAKIPDAAGTAVAVSINLELDRAKKNIQNAIDKMTVPKPDFRLFEIRMKAGVTTLVEVNTETIRKTAKQMLSEEE